MRIISGKYRGRLIQPPSGLPVRPTLDRAKEGLFNILMHRYGLVDIDVLELFAGTGNMTYEFLSRGANSVTAVDQHAGCVAFMEKMMKMLNAENGHAIRAEAVWFLQQCTDSFDLIFMDPPYAMVGQHDLVELCFSKKILREDGVLILEHNSAVSWEQNPWFTEARSYGGSTFSFFVSPSQ